MDEYHKKYANLPDSEIQNRLIEKKEELREVFSKVFFQNEGYRIRIAVLGCADKRLISGHKKIFEEVIGKKVEITTFDISIEHLAGEERVIKHDCTLPLPGKFDITYAHVLLKFIDKDKQWEIIKNSNDAVEDCGIAIHVLDKDDYETGKVKLARLIEKLKENSINYKEVPVKYGKALVLIK